jgi:hypothetical protein
MANNTWGIYPWSQGEWGQQTTDVVVEVGIQQGWGRSSFGDGPKYLITIASASSSVLP